jgi:hypothetical protein
VVVASVLIAIQLVVSLRLVGGRVIPSKNERELYDNKNSPIGLAAGLATCTLSEAPNFFRDKSLWCSSGCDRIVRNNSCPFHLVFLTGSDSFILIAFFSDHYCGCCLFFDCDQIGCRVAGESNPIKKRKGTIQQQK